MAVRNYTTSISTEKTIMEIEQILVKFGATGIYKDYLGNRINGIIFNLSRQGQSIPFKIPMNIDKTRTIITSAVHEGKLARRFLTEPLRSAQGERVAWRIIKDWIDSQLSLMEMRFAEATEIFLPYAYNPIENKTIYEIFIENKEKLLALPEQPPAEQQ